MRNLEGSFRNIFSKGKNKDPVDETHAIENIDNAEKAAKAENADNIENDENFENAENGGNYKYTLS